MRRRTREENFWKFYLDPEKEDKEDAIEFLERAGIDAEEEKRKLINRINEIEEKISPKQEKVNCEF